MMTTPKMPGLLCMLLAAVAVTPVVGRGAPPEAVADSATTTVGVPVFVPVLANDRDADGDSVFISDADFRSERGGRVLISNNGVALVYIPAQGFTGKDGFGYTVVDTTGLTSVGTVALEVGGGDAPSPIAPPPAALVLPGVFSSHMVLQRDMSVPVWGRAKPGQQVTVTFRRQEKRATADDAGNWRILLDPLAAGGPDLMAVRGGGEIVLSDVLVGEVWVGSGQSNMDLDVGSAGDPALAAAVSAAQPNVRLFVSGASGWQESTPENNRGFSALMLAFGIPLQREMNVPLGLIEAAVGATAAASWISESGYLADPDIRAAFDRYRDVEHPALLAEFLERQRAADAAADAAGQPRPHPPHREGRPCAPKPAGHWAGRWKQGVHFNHYDGRIRPILTYGIRGVLWDQGESGTGVVGIGTGPMMRGLIRQWRKEWQLPAASRPGAPGGDFPWLYVQKPSGPGCAWDYENPVTRLALPFAPLPESVPDTAAGLGVEEFVRLREHPHTAMAISSDLGGGVHPANKFGYGARLARVALGAVYGRPVEYYGPVHAAHAVEGAAVRVRFEHVGQGLAWKHGDRLQGFAIAGADRVFHWADARIDGDAVVVSSDRVQAPIAVRYAWGGTYPWANLFNRDGLPALPFRTDDW